MHNFPRSLRAQHIKCTEEHPRCRRCERLDLECVRELKIMFREDAIQRGISFGREGVWTKRPGTTAHNRKTESVFQGLPLTQYTSRLFFLNLNEGDFQDSDDVPRTHSSAQVCPNSIDICTDLSIQSSIYHPLYSFPDTETYLLDYFIRGISPSCSLSELYNPYISLLVPLCFVSITLRHAVLAVSANQLCLLGKDQFAEQVCHHKHMALQGLRREISAGVHADATVASILMLCFHDISDGCSPSWMTHLHGGLQLIDHTTSRGSSDLWKFFRMYFVAHNIMSRTASENCHQDDILELWSDSENLEEIDMLMGCSRGLLTLINNISIHASEKAKIQKYRRLTPAETQYYAKVSLDISTALLGLKQTLPQHATGREDLERIAQVKHLAAFLYLNERLEDKLDIDDRRRRGVSEGCKSRLISSMIELISTLPDMATLLWPLFVLGNTGLENEEQRRFVLDRLANIQKTRNLGSVKRTIDAVKHAFVTKSLCSSGNKAWVHETYRYISLA
ncbi:Pc22g16640 [Penicillium rubens Wisconsin 54-1255]|uniref:Pc22g16640 protein n=2 Tax=Penicillium chrysogenum species complex TaxID=254878 RepID=B6HRJ7_PENRW|nr:Pc22g16640 [Penicillium rubens Wisconsin 54-1255]